MSVQLGCNYLNEAQSQDLDGFDVALGDEGVSSWADRHLTEKIQPLTLQAPEVLIEAPWDSKADVWNLVAVMLEVYRNVRMFRGASRAGCV
ncbi:putative serine-threonine protein kinase [Diaporthe ampelina]|uniref:Putative serine-threonine protein kinase n=1 Tax=Diaporthe ampelina TaxID=1214573 RepID=A0A0G2H7R9_9PEZI|nr:putative serine-threonine protein kinase [Diaporthe ampelina]